jgi:hypothetical protein
MINPNYQQVVNFSLYATGIAAATLLTRCESIKIIGTTVLTAVSYGILNDMIACRDCIEYFTIGHRYDGRNLRYRPLNTLNPNLNALVWGAIATWHVSAIAGAVFAIFARMPFPKLSVKITAAQLAPCLAIGAFSTLIIAHVASRRAEQKMRSNPFMKYNAVPLAFQSGWEACNTRNSVGYLSLLRGGIALSVLIIAARAGIIKWSQNKILKLLPKKSGSVA